MKLSQFLDDNRIRPVDFARTLKIAPSSVYRYMHGESVPEAPVMRRIMALTDGAVSASDFFEPAKKRAK